MRWSGGGEAVLESIGPVLRSTFEGEGLGVAGQTRRCGGVVSLVDAERLGVAARAILLEHPDGAAVVLDTHIACTVSGRGGDSRVSGGEHMPARAVRLCASGLCGQGEAVGEWRAERGARSARSGSARSRITSEHPLAAALSMHVFQTWSAYVYPHSAPSLPVAVGRHCEDPTVGSPLMHKSQYLAAWWQRLHPVAALARRRSSAASNSALDVALLALTWVDSVAPPSVRRALPSALPSSDGCSSRRESTSGAKMHLPSSARMVRLRATFHRSSEASRSYRMSRSSESSSESARTAPR
jgi:hypothetical protein